MDREGGWVQKYGNRKKEREEIFLCGILIMNIYHPEIVRFSLDAMCN